MFLLTLHKCPFTFTNWKFYTVPPYRLQSIIDQSYDVILDRCYYTLEHSTCFPDTSSI